MPGKKRRILVVEPDEEIRRTLKERLMDELECQVLDVPNFREAMDALSYFKPDLLIMELILPDKNGVDLIIAVKQRLPGTKIIVYTEIKGKVIEKTVKKKGADVFYHKTSSLNEDISQLIKLIEDIYKPKTPEQEEGFRGSLEGVDLKDLIQAFSLMGKDIIIHVRDIRSYKEGKIFFRGGALIDARTGRKAGKEALKEILSWERGVFEVSYPGPDTNMEQTIDEPLEMLLLDIAREQDEMLAEQETRPKMTPKEVLKRIRAEIPGFIAAMVFDYAEGVPDPDARETILGGRSFQPSASGYSEVLHDIISTMVLVTEGKEQEDDLLHVIITDKNDHVILVPLHVDSYAFFLLISSEVNPYEALNVIKRYIPLLVEIYKARNA